MSDCQIKDECLALFHRLYLPDGDPQKLTATEFGICMRGKINEARKETQEEIPEIIKKAEKIFDAAKPERGCKNDDDKWEY